MPNIKRNIELREMIEETAKKRRTKVVMHFLHSSLEIPESAYYDFVQTKEAINRLTIKMGDVLLLDLFKYWNFKKL